MSKHTPGPWKIRNDITKDTLICSENKTIICGIHQKNLNILSETKANAQLIAAAPELLEKLEIVLKHSEEGLLINGKLADQISDIISKVEGADE